MFNMLESKWVKPVVFFLSLLLVCVISVSISIETASVNTESVNKDVKRTWQDLIERKRVESLKRNTILHEEIDRDGVMLGAWYCTGPFKDEFKGIHFRSFNHVFPPEREVLTAGRDLIDLSQTWEVNRYPGMVENMRRWEKQLDWVDGYRNELPMGPPPGLNETVFLYRTISVQRDATLDMHVYAEDDVRAWINGHCLGEAYPAGGSSSGRMPAALKTKLPLKKGDNYLLVKITTMFGPRGFAFGLPGLTPSHEVSPDQMIENTGEGFSFLRSEDRFYPGNEPYCSGVLSSPETTERRYRIYREAKDLIPRNGDAVELYEAYTRALLKVLGLPNDARSLLPWAKNDASVEYVRQLYYQACKYTDSLSRLHELRLNVPVMPMYDPPEIEMHQVLETTSSGSPEGDAYLSRLNNLHEKVETALAKDNTTAPDSEESVLKAADAIESMWRDVIGALEPIAFIKAPRNWVNAISPYASKGTSPASICVYDPAQPSKPPRVIYHDEEGAVLNMNLSYDAKTIFFTAKPKSGIRGGWDIYEIGIDGTGLRRITYGKRELEMGSTRWRFYDNNMSPIELPSGEIMFASTRANTYVNCQNEPSSILYVANRDGTNVRRVSANTESDYTPQVLNDGRIIFTRWDYGVDKNVFVRQSLWTINPDGSHYQLFSGNTIEDPNSFWEARAIPGRPEVACVFGPHHLYQAGMIGLVWNRLGFEVPRGTGFRWITQELPIVDDITLPWGYHDPYPLNERLFLVSYGGDGQERNRIYLLDDRSNKKCIYEDAELGCWNPLLLRPRKRPPVIAPISEQSEFVYRDPSEDNQNPNPRWGTLFVQDVYEGISSHFKRGEIESLAIMEQLPKTGYPIRGGKWGSNPITGRGTMHVRRLVGIVPVEPDGSAYFLAPGLKDISFNALDAEGRTIMKMGAPIQVMPGETIGCIGCHEHRHMAPPANPSMPIAVRRAVSMPQQPEWGTKGIIDFVKVVQPVFDRYCISCHSGPQPAALVDLSNDKTKFFNMAYNNLVDRGLVDYAQANSTDHGETGPRNEGAVVSRIRQFIETDHSGQVLPLADRQRIYSWIDAGIPYYGTYTFTNPYAGRYRWYTREEDGWFQADFMPVFQRRCVDCHKRTVQIQAYNYRHHDPERAKVTVTSKIWTDYAQREWFSGEYAYVGPSHRINLTHPEWSQMLTAPLAAEAGGLGLCKNRDGSPIFANKSDPDYQVMLGGLKEANRRLMADPRVDMLDRIPPRLGIELGRDRRRR